MAEELTKLELTEFNKFFFRKTQKRAKNMEVTDALLIWHHIIIYICGIKIAQAKYEFIEYFISYVWNQQLRKKLHKTQGSKNMPKKCKVINGV